METRYNVIGMWKTKKGPACRQAGFTLIELLVVMGVISVLAAVTSVLVIGNNISKGRDAKRKSDLEAIRSALEVYKNDYGHYPISCGWISHAYASPAQSLSQVDNFVPNYITVLPKDPEAVDDFGGGNFGYLYGTYGCGNVASDGRNYSLWTNMDLAADGDSSLIGASDTTYDANYSSPNDHVYKVINP